LITASREINDTRPACRPRGGNADLLDFTLRHDGSISLERETLRAGHSPKNYSNPSTNRRRSSKFAGESHDEELAKIWTLTYKGNNFFHAAPAVMRSMVISHLIHHRGQLGVYLRLNNVEFPGLRPVGDETISGKQKTA